MNCCLQVVTFEPEMLLSSLK